MKLEAICGTRQTLNKSTQPESSANLIPCPHTSQLKKLEFLCTVLLQKSFAPLSYQVVFASNLDHSLFAILTFHYYHLLSPFYLLILIMNSLICYLLVWIASFFFPGLIYFLLELFRKKDKQDGKPTMPYFNKFSIILLSIFASLNVIMYHLIIQVSNSS